MIGENPAVSDAARIVRGVANSTDHKPTAVPATVGYPKADATAVIYMLGSAISGTVVGTSKTGGLSG